MAGETPNRSGDGNTSPFGDGRGGGDSSMKGNNFVQNPRGNPASTGGGQPAASQRESRPQESRQAGRDYYPQQVPSGGTLPFTPPQNPGAKEIGTRPSGNRSPMKVGKV